MISIDCSHCGATLRLSGASVPTAIRCRRCGMSNPTAGVRPTRGGVPPAPEPAGPPPAPMPPRGVDEIGSPFHPGTTVRVTAEEVHPPSRPRPGFYDPESPLESHAGKAALIAGTVVGAVVAMGAAAWLLLAPSIAPTTLLVAPASDSQGTAAQSGVPQDSVPLPPPPPPPADGAGGTASAPSAASSEFAPQKPAPAGGTMAEQIDVQPMFNDEVYLSSELSLRTYVQRELKVLDEEELEALLKEAIGAKTLEELNRSVQGIAAAIWRNSQWPTFALIFSGVPAGGVSVSADMRCMDPTARKLLVGGPATETYPVRVMPNEDGRASLDIDLRLDSSNVYALTSPANINLTVDIRYQDGSVDKVQHTCRVLPVSFVEQRAPFHLGFAAMVDEDHPLVRDLLAKITTSDSVRGWGVSPGGPDLLPQVFVVWRELRARGIRYSSIAETSSSQAQEVRPLQDALMSGNANCADGTALLASILQKMGAKPEMVFVPGHVFIGLPLEVGDEQLGLETTLLEDSDPCTPEFRERLEREHPDCKAFAAKLGAGDLREWLAMLRAVEVGHDLIQKEWKVIREGGARPDGRTAKPVSEVLSRLERAVSAEDEAAFVELLTALLGDYMRVLSISQAREWGVRPIGHDPRMLPKDGVGRLRSK